MRRIISLVVVALVMAAMMLATALPAFAQASENAGR
jgi:type II secretory pathway component PulF